MNKIKFIIILFLLFLFTQITFAKKKTTDSSKESLSYIIKSSLEQYSYKIGFIKLIPEFKLFIYYDSNILSSNLNEVSDLVIEAGPGLTEKFALGNLALIKAYQYISYVYYKDLDNLRNTPHNLNLSITTGRKSFIITLQGASNKGIVKPSSEADIPANQLLRYYNASAKIPLFHKFKLHLFYDRNEYSYHDYFSYYGKSIDEALARKENIYNIQFSYNITSKTSLFFLTNREEFKFAYKPIIRDYEGSQYVAGIEINQSAFFSGFIKMGYYKLIPQNPDFSPFKGFIINTLLDYTPTEFLKFKFNILRKPQFSVFYSINDHYVQNQFSINIIWAYTSKQAISLGFMIGKNNYVKSKLISNEDKLDDRYKEGRISYIYKFRKDLYLESGASYFKRDSNYEFFIRKRLLFFANLKYAI